MPRFKKSEKLLDDWANLAVLTRRYNQADNPVDRVAIATESMALLSALREEFGDELRDALAIVSSANDTINTTRGQQIAQYHRNRIHKLEQSLEVIDDTLMGAAVAPEEGVAIGPPSILEVAESTSQRKQVEYELRDHAAKVDTRSHGIVLTQMRRKHR